MYNSDAIHLETVFLIVYFRFLLLPSGKFYSFLIQVLHISGQICSRAFNEFLLLLHIGYLLFCHPYSFLFWKNPIYLLLQKKKQRRYSVSPPMAVREWTYNLSLNEMLLLGTSNLKRTIQGSVRDIFGVATTWRLEVSSVAWW